MTLPNLPTEGSTDWYDWAQGVDTSARTVIPAAVSTSNTATQNSTALNAAVAAASTSGGMVVIPAGTFDHNGFTLPVKGKVVVRGSGRGSTVLNNVHATNASITAHGVGGGVDPVNPYCIDWLLADLTLTASAVRSTQVGVSVLLATRFTVHDVTIVDHGVGVRNKAAWDQLFESIVAYGCTIGWEFPAPAPYTVSCPVTLSKCSAISCGTAVINTDSTESVSWSGGDFSACGVGVSITGTQVRNFSMYGVNFEQITGKDVVVGDGTTSPSAVSFINCRFMRHSLVGGSISSDIIRGGPVSYMNCSWNNYALAVQQSGNTGALYFASNVASGVTKFLDSNGVSMTNIESAIVTVPGKISIQSATAAPMSQSKAWEGSAGPFALTFEISLPSFTSAVGTLAIGGSQFNNSTNRVAYLGTLLVSSKNNTTDAWGAYVTAAGTPVGLAAGPTVAVTGTGSTRTLTVTFTATNSDVFGGSCAISLAYR